jgi:hypothetical protein
MKTRGSHAPNQDGNAQKASPVVNLNFSRSVDELEGLADAGQYVVLQNERLHAENAQLRDAKAALERSLANRTSENEGIERSRICMRGLVHNKIEEATSCDLLCQEYERRMRGARGAHAVFLAPMIVVMVWVFLAASAALRTHWTPDEQWCRCAAAGTAAAWADATRLLVLAVWALAFQRGLLVMRHKLDADAPELVRIRAEVRRAQRANRMLHELVDEV